MGPSCPGCGMGQPLIDMGAQIITIAHSFIRQLQLEVHDLNEVIWVEGFTVPYLGYVELICGSHSFPNTRGQY